MKKYLTLILASALMLTSISCASARSDDGTATASGDTSSPAETAAPEETDRLPDTDMEGFELKINHFDGTLLSWALVQLDAEAETGDRLSDAIYKRNRTIEERFNCKISVNGQETIQTNDMIQEVMAGDSNYDLWFSYDIWTLGAAEYLLPWEEIPYINLDREWWNPMATEVFQLGGKTYAAAGNYSLSVLSRASGFVFNKGIFNDINPDEDIYAIAADGKWTITQLYQFAKSAYRDLNGDTKMEENDRYGISGSWKEVFNRLMLGSGIQYISKDSEGYPVFTLPTDENAIDKILKIADLFFDQQVYYNTGKAMDTTGDGMLPEDFSNGRTLFYQANLFDLEKMRSYDIDIGFLPCPKYDENQEHYYAPSFGAEISVLLKTLPNERYENVGILLEALAFDSNRNIIPEYKEVLLKTKYARDNESEDMIDIIVNSISFEFGLNAWQDIVANPLVKNIFVPREANVTSALAKMENKVNGEIENLKKRLG
ncbi:MAG: hypothetical protein ACI3XM_03450 [Eubacteriales bacterium]